MQSLTSKKAAEFAEKQNLNLEEEEEKTQKSSAVYFDSRINSTKDSSNFTTEHNDLNEAFILMNSEQSAEEFSFANKCKNDSTQPEEEILK